MRGLQSVRPQDDRSVLSSDWPVNLGYLLGEAYILWFWVCRVQIQFLYKIYAFFRVNDFSETNGISQNVKKITKNYRFPVNMRNKNNGKDKCPEKRRKNRWDWVKFMWVEDKNPVFMRGGIV